MGRWPHPYGRKRRTEEPLDESERGEWKSWLKIQYSKSKIMASSPITSWQIDGGRVADFILGGSKITADGDCSHNIKRHQPRQHIKKQRYYFADKGPSSQSYGFSSFSKAMYGCESWTIKKAELQRIDAFALCCWRRLLRVPWTARRSSPPILKDISPEYSFEEMILKLKLQYFGYLKWRTDSLEKTLMLGKIECGRQRGRHRIKWMDGITDSVDMSLSKLWVLVMYRGA